MDDINSDRLQYSQDAINTTIDIMSNVAIKMEGQTPMSNTTTKRRKLNVWNVFTKRKSLVRVLRHRFESYNDFVAYVCDNNEFRYHSKRDRSRKRKKLNNNSKREIAVADKLSSEVVGEEYNNLTHEQSDAYKFIADELNKLRDEDCREL